MGEGSPYGGQSERVHLKEKKVKMYDEKKGEYIFDRKNI